MANTLGGRATRQSVWRRPCDSKCGAARDTGMVGAAGADRTLVRVADDRGLADTNVQAYPGRYRPDLRGHDAARGVGATRRASPHRV